MIRAARQSARGNGLQQIDPSTIGTLLPDRHAFVWLEIADPDKEDIDLLRTQFGFHELALEDAVFPHQRPKLDEYDEYYFMVFYRIGFDGPSGDLELVELDLFIGHNFIVAVHKGEMAEVEEALLRWERNHEHLGHGAGSLVHSLLDTLVDGYFQTVDQVAEQIGDLEEKVFRRPRAETLQSVFQLKKRLLGMRRVLGPERDALNTLMRQDIPLLENRTLLYLRDVYDHLARIMDTVDLYSDLLSNALDIYLSTVSNRLNQIMKTLTSWTIILMSVALIAGVYGMNFHNMPELGWDLGYFYALGLMLATGIALFFYLKRRDWL